MAPPSASAPAIIQLSAAGATDELETLLRGGGSNVDASHEIGTALHWASLRGHDGVCDLLLRHRADPNALNGAGMGPLSYAVLGEGHSHPRVVALLLEHGARDRPGNDGMTCLMAAALMGEMDVVRMLWESGADIDAEDGGKTALDMAVANGHLGVASFLRNAVAELTSNLVAGTAVRIVGLKSRPELNGSIAEVLSAPASGGRVPVRVASTHEDIRVKPLAIRLAPSTSATPGATAAAAKNTECAARSEAAAALGSGPASSNRALRVCWLKPESNGETYLPSLLPVVEQCATFKPSNAGKLREYLTANGMAMRKCLIPQLVGEPLVLWLKIQHATPNGLATALASYWTADGPKAVCGLALLVRSTREDGMPTADVFDSRGHAELLRTLMFINDATLPHSDINLGDGSVRAQLTRLWPAYDAEHTQGDTLVGRGSAGVRVEKHVGGNTKATISLRNVDEYLANPTEWVASRRPADADEREANPFGLTAAEDAAFRESMRRRRQGKPWYG